MVCGEQVGITESSRDPTAQLHSFTRHDLSLLQHSAYVNMADEDKEKAEKVAAAKKRVRSPPGTM